MIIRVLVNFAATNNDFCLVRYTVATFRKGVRAIQMVGRASMYLKKQKTKN